MKDRTIEKQEIINCHQYNTVNERRTAQDTYQNLQDIIYLIEFVDL